jgi:endonuclease/exonuclease/phosphatase family metal-dependent hydrolase
LKIKCISLNLWDGGNLLPNIFKFLEEHADADLILLQEAYNSPDPALIENYRSVEVLQAKTGLPYAHFAPMVLDKLLIGKVEAGNAILSKFPILSSDVQFFDETYRERNAYDITGNPTMPRILQHVVVDAEGTKLNLYNLHGVWDLDGDNYSELRQNMSRVIRENVQGKQRAILAGDSNAKPTNKAMRDIEDCMFSVFGDGLKTTYNMRRKTNPGFATAACDVMYVSPDIKVIEKSCPDVDISDHLPLIVTLDIS